MTIKARDENGLTFDVVRLGARRLVDEFGNVYHYRDSFTERTIIAGVSDGTVERFDRWEDPTDHEMIVTRTLEGMLE